MSLKDKEIEVKLQIGDATQIDCIESYITELAEMQNRKVEKIVMKAVYYDTKDGCLRKDRGAYRIRQENKSIVATYKQGIVNQNGISERVEVNKNVTSLKPNITVFKDSDTVWHRLKSLENIEFIPVIMTDFIRKSVQIKWQNSLIEIALDQGEIVADKKKIPICEVELELKAGDKSELSSLTKEFTKKFFLVPSNDSKYHRGLILAGLA